MSDRSIFVAALLTAALIVAAAFELPQFFFFELAKSTIYLAIAVLVYFGENRYSYMLGMIAPTLWSIVDILGGIFLHDFRILLDYVTGKGIAPLQTPLDALARLSSIALIMVSARAWRKEVPEKFVGRTFSVCSAASLIYALILAGWHLRIVEAVR
jgi:hypothetical protein